MPLVPYYKITIVLPLNEDLDGQPSVLPKDAINMCDPLEPLISLLQKSDPVGRTGDYIGVFGLHLRSGGFMADEGASPQKGKIGSIEEGLCYEFFTYATVETNENILDEFMKKVYDIHPWEHPTIEINQIKAWEPR